MNAMKLAVVPGSGSMPDGTILSRKSAGLTAASSSLLMRSTIAPGVPFGAKRPAQWPIWMPGNPCSFAVGSVSYAVIRFVYVVAIALSLPPFTCGSTIMLASEVAGTLFAITAVTPSAPLLYGMMLMATPASRSISATKWGVLPPPAVAQLTPPVCDFDHATSSFRFVTGTLGLTAITDGATAIIPTGTRSLSAYGMSFRIMLFVTTPAA